jgi:hypothetical protein
MHAPACTHTYAHADTCRHACEHATLTKRLFLSLHNMRKQRKGFQILFNPQNKRVNRIRMEKQKGENRKEKSNPGKKGIAWSVK